MSRRRIGAVALAVVAMLAVGAIGESTRTAGQEAAKLRVGTYDNRAIATAWGRSKFMRGRYQELRTARDEAEAAGDDKRVKEVEDHTRWGQKQLHLQGFGHWPVRDLLLDIRAELPEVARQAKVDLIAWEYDYRGANVETVDITGFLVAQFDPSAETLEAIENVRRQKPVSLEQLITWTTESPTRAHPTAIVRCDHVGPGPPDTEDLLMQLENRNSAPAHNLPHHENHHGAISHPDSGASPVDQSWGEGGCDQAGTLQSVPAGSARGHD